MQTIIKAITDRIERLEKYRAGIRKEISASQWEGYEMSLQILHSDLDYVEKQLAIASGELYSIPDQY